MTESKAIFTETQLGSNLWQIHEDGAGQSIDCYLIIGTEKAALIDSLMGGGNRRLYDMVREKTGLPLVILHTHGHGDHAGAELQAFIEAGCEAYVPPLDFPILGSFGAAYPAEIFTHFVKGSPLTWAVQFWSVWKFPVTRRAAWFFWAKGINGFSPGHPSAPAIFGCSWGIPSP